MEPYDYESHAVLKPMKLIGGEEYLYADTLTLKLKERFEDGLEARKLKAQRLEQAKGAQDPAAISEWHKLARLYAGKGDKRQATTYNERAFEGALYGPGLDSPQTIVLMSDLTEYYESHAMFQALVKLRQKISQHLEAKYGSQDLRTLRAQNDALIAMLRNKDYDEAKKLGYTLLASLEKAHIKDGDLPVLVKQKLATALTGIGMRQEPGFVEEFKRAASFMEEAAQGYESASQTGTENYLYVLRNLRNLYIDLQDWPKAIEKGNQVVERSIQLFGSQSKETLDFQQDLMVAYWGAGRFQEMFQLGLEIGKTCVALGGYSNPETIEMGLNLHRMLDDFKPTTTETIKVYLFLLAILQANEREMKGEDYDNREKLLACIQSMEKADPESLKRDMDLVRK